MSDFKPSTKAAGAALGASTPIVTGPHPGGAVGAAVSLKEVCKRIRDGRLDPRVRAWAIKVVNDSGRPKSNRGKAQALLDALRVKSVYVPDPVAAEFVQSAALTLCLDEMGLCFAGGDCDDLCVAFGSSSMSIGIPTKVVGQSFDGSNVPSHVICSIQGDSGEWLRVDPSSDKLRVGEAVSATGEMTLDPMELDTMMPGLEGLAEKANAEGGPAGDYVGVGRFPTGLRGVPSAQQRPQHTIQRTWHRTGLGWHCVDRVVVTKPVR